MNDSQQVKMLMVGPGGVGKSCLILKTIHNLFAEEYDPTIEDEYRLTRIVDLSDTNTNTNDDNNNNDNTNNNNKDKKDKKDKDRNKIACNIDIMDTAGCMGFLHSEMSQRYICFTHACIIMYSITSISSFKEVETYRNYVLRYKNVPLYLVGNKCDLENERQVTKEEGEELAKTLNCPFVETSAKSGVNADVAFVELAAMVLKERKEHPQPRKNNKCTLL